MSDHQRDRRQPAAGRGSRNPRRGRAQGTHRQGGARHTPDQKRSGDTARERRSTPRPDARSVALAVMGAVRERTAYANLTLPAQLRRARLDARDSALATELTYGTLRSQGLLDRIITLASSRPVE